MFACIHCTYFYTRCLVYYFRELNILGILNAANKTVEIMSAGINWLPSSFSVFEMSFLLDVYNKGKQLLQTVLLAQH